MRPSATTKLRTSEMGLGSAARRADRMGFPSDYEWTRGNSYARVEFNQPEKSHSNPRRGRRVFTQPGFFPMSMPITAMVVLMLAMGVLLLFWRPAPASSPGGARRGRSTAGPSH